MPDGSATNSPSPSSHPLDYGKGRLGWGVAKHGPGSLQPQEAQKQVSESEHLLPILLLKASLPSGLQLTLLPQPSLLWQPSGFINILFWLVYRRHPLSSVCLFYELGCQGQMDHVLGV